MSIGLDLLSLVTYGGHERLKWKAWFTADPSRLQIPFQRADRFPTIGSLLDHVFLVQRRHLSRLEGATPPESTGIPPGDVDALFEYAELVQADLLRYAADLDEAHAQERLTFSIQSGQVTVTRRKLLVHILVHEIRHMAQIASAGRAAGHNPPGQHDYLYSPTDT